MTNDKEECAKVGEKCSDFIQCCGPEDAGGSVLRCRGIREGIGPLECYCHEKCGGRNIEFFLTQNHI